MSFDTIRTEIADSVMTITLDRPDRLNAFTHVMRDELIEAFDVADRIVVIGLNYEQPWLRGAQRRQLIQRGRCAIVFDDNMLEERR